MARYDITLRQGVVLHLEVLGRDSQFILDNCLGKTGNKINEELVKSSEYALDCYGSDAFAIRKDKIITFSRNEHFKVDIEKPRNKEREC